MKKNLSLILSVLLVVALLIPLSAPMILAEGEEPSEQASSEEPSEQVSSDEPSEQVSSDEPSEQSQTPEYCTFSFNKDARYTVTVSETYTGMSFKSGVYSYEYSYGETITVTVAAVEPYRINGILIDNDYIDTNAFTFDVEMTSDHELSVECHELAKFVLRSSFSFEESLGREMFSISIDGNEFTDSVDVIADSAPVITISLNDGIESVSFAVKEAIVLFDDGTTASCTVNQDNSVLLPKMVDSGYLFLTFASSIYTISINQTDGGVITADTLSPKPDSLITFTFTPDEGYELKTIIINGIEIIPTGNTYQAVANGDITVSAVFNPPAKDVTVSCIVVADESGLPHGTASFTDFPNVNTVTIKEGNTISITFTPDEGYTIGTLKVNGYVYDIGTGNVLSVPVANDMEVKVTYERITFCITAIITGNVGGTITAEGYEIVNKQVYVKYGDKIKFILSPDMGYITDMLRVGEGFTEKVYYDASKADPNKPFNNVYEIPSVTSNMIIRATFTLEGSVVTKYEITSAAGEHGSITPSGKQTVVQGENFSFVVTPDSGWDIDYVTVDGEDVSLSNGMYTFSNVSANHTIAAFFKEREVDDPDIIEVGDVDFAKSVIVIDLTSVTRIQGEVFRKLAADYIGRTVVIKLKDCEFTFIVSGALATEENEITAAVKKGQESESHAAVSEALASSVQHKDSIFEVIEIPSFIPESSTVKIRLDSRFSGKQVSCYYYAENELVRVSGNIPCDANGNVSATVKQSNVLVFITEQEKIITYEVTFKTPENGKIAPCEKMTVNKNSIITFTVTPDEGYKVARVLVNGKEIAIAEKEYKLTITEDTDIEVRFVSVSVEESSKLGLIVSIVIIAIALIGGGVLFVIKWRQTRY